MKTERGVKAKATVVTELEWSYDKRERGQEGV